MRESRKDRTGSGQSQGRYKLLLLTATLIWGFSFFIVKDTTDVLPVDLILSIRFFVGALLLAVIFNRRLREHHDIGTIARGCLLGVFIFLAYWFQTVGITDTTPGKNAFLTSGYCVIVPFLFWAVDRQRPDAYNIIAAFLLITGIGLISLGSDLSVRFGDYMTMICGIFYAIHIVAVAHFSKGRDIFVLTIWQFISSGICATIMFLASESMPDTSVWTPQVIGSLAFLAIGCTAIGLLFQNIGQKHVEPSVASIILSLESVFGVIFSVIFYHEMVTARLFAGFAIVFLAVIVSETKLSFIPFLRRSDGIPVRQERL